MIPPIMILTCESRRRVAQAAWDLIRKHWPDHPAMNMFVMHCRPDRWTNDLLLNIRAWPHPSLMLWLDDYMMLEPPNLPLLQAAADILETDPDCGRIDLWQTVPEEAQPYQRDARFLVHPPWPYPVILQAAFWKTRSLLRVLELLPGRDPWHFELDGGALQNAGKLDRYQLATVGQAVNYGNLLCREGVRAQWVLDYVRGQGIDLKDEDLPRKES